MNLIYNYIYNVKRFIKTLLLQFSIQQSLELNNILNLKIKEFQMIYDSQVYTALCIALLAGILAIRLGSTLYE